MGVLCCKDRNGLEEDPKADSSLHAVISVSNLNTPFYANKVNKKDFDTFGDKIRNSNDLFERTEGGDRILSDNIISDHNNSLNKPCKCFFNKINDNFFFRVYIEHFELFYKQSDDFGLVFKPYIELLVSGQDPERITNIDEEKFNNSLVSDNNNSFNSDNPDSTPVRTNMSFHSNNNITALKEGKIFYYKSSKNYSLPKNSFFNSIIISVKNESSFFNSLLPKISIGDARIPINLIVKAGKILDENIFTGMIELKNKNNLFVGFIKVNLTVSLKSFDGQDSELVNKLINKNSLNGEEDGFNLLNKPNNIWNKVFIHHSDLDPEILHNYFIFDLDTIDQQINLVKEFLSRVYQIEMNKFNSNSSFNITDDINGENNIEKNSNVNCNYLIKVFQESIIQHNENFVLLYELFIFLIKLENAKGYTLIDVFLKNVLEDNKNDFYNLPSFTDYNMHFLKLYLIFIFNYQIYQKSNKLSGMKNSKYLEDSVIIEKLIEITKKISERVNMNKSVINEEYSLELRDCLIWCINIINETISQSTVLIKSKNYSKNEIIEEKMKDYNQVYDNCIEWISYRIILIKLLENYLDDSQIVSGVVRLFRKTIQILSYDSHFLLDQTKEPKIFAKQFKKLLISQNDGLFITTLRTILAKYYHYPEIHNNILIILYQITNYLDIENLVLTAEKLNLEEFKENFYFYRGKFVIFCKLLNNLHLNILANLSAIAKTSTDTNNKYEPIIKNIMLDLKAFYRKTVNSKKRFEYFKLKKFNEVEIHEVITKIGVNVTKYQNLTHSLLESNFNDDIIEYLKAIAYANEKGEDFIQQHADKKGRSIDEIKKYVLSIVENSQILLINIIDSDDEEISKQLISHEIADHSQLVELFNKCKEVLSKNGCSVAKIEKNLINFNSLFI